MSLLDVVVAKKRIASSSKHLNRVSRVLYELRIFLPEI